MQTARGGVAGVEDLCRGEGMEGGCLYGFRLYANMVGGSV